MARVHRVATAFSVVMGLSALTACSGKDPYNPGEPVGAFHVTAKLVSSTCGPSPTPWEFDVRLRHELTTLYWVQGAAPISGIADSSARVVLESGAQETVRAADARSRTPACTIAREDTVDVTLLDAASAKATELSTATSFAGTLVYRFSPTSDSDCSDQLTAVGGGYDAMPCEVRYELTAKRTGDLKP